MSVFERCLSYRESNEGSKEERQRPRLGACLTKLSYRGVHFRESQLYSIKQIQYMHMYNFMLLSVRSLVPSQQNSVDKMT